MRRSTTPAFGACAAITLLATAAWSPPQDPAILLGRTIDQVVERFGITDEWVASTSSLMCTYQGIDGTPGVFVFCDGVAVQVPPFGFRPKAIQRPPTERAWSGQRLGEAVLRLGNPVRWEQSSSTSTFHYADGTDMNVHQGRAFVRSPR